MKTLKNYITEAFKINKNIKLNKINYFPESTIELQQIIIQKYNENEKQIDVSDIDISKLKDLNHVFAECVALEHIIGLETWDVSHIKYFNSLFMKCFRLQEVDGTKNWNIVKGISFIDMFDRCGCLKSIDVSNWDMSNTNIIDNMFCGCSKLIEIKGLENWNLSQCTDFDDVFEGSIKIKELKIKSWIKYFIDEEEMINTLNISNTTKIV